MSEQTVLYAGYGDMWQRVLDMARRMPDVDAIAGVPVSGLASAGMLSASAGIKCVPLEAVPDGVKRLLVLEDASGFCKFQAARMGWKEGREVLYAAVYACGRATTDLDLIGCEANKPRIFTWNLTKSDRARLFAYDLDGVFCRDPVMDELDYGPKYERFIEKTRRIRVAPSFLGWIVTGRMERYREQTAKWLADHDIRYGELVMAPDDQVHTMEAHAQHKAQWYAASPAILFVESSARQAERIAELTGKPVICTSTERGYNTRPPCAVPVVSLEPNKKVIYTISTGQYEACAPRNYRPPSGWDYMLITGADCPQYLSPKQQAAWAKINGPRLFARYEASLCIDDDMTVLRDPSPLFSDSEMTALRRANVSTWHDDLDTVVRVRRAVAPEAADAEKKRLTALGITNSQNWLSGIIWRKHTDAVRRLCDEWWYWYGQSETKRDQPSLAVACQVLKYTPASITEDQIPAFIRHDTKKADRDGVRIRIQPDPAVPQTPRRRGDRK